jgi:hypothetical protein
MTGPTAVTSQLLDATIPRHDGADLFSDGV